MSKQKFVQNFILIIEKTYHLVLIKTFITSTKTSLRYGTLYLEKNLFPDFELTQFQCDTSYNGTHRKKAIINNSRQMRQDFRALTELVFRVSCKKKI